MNAPEVVRCLAGGALIGVATALLLLFNGRTAGISGIFDGAFGSAQDERRWSRQFLAGLLAGGLAAHVFAPSALGASTAPLPVLAVAGVLVGFGTRLGGGCTSGHGVCGMSRGSPRSFAATGTFMVVAAAIVFVVARGARP